MPRKRMKEATMPKVAPYRCIGALAPESFIKMMLNYN